MMLGLGGLGIVFMLAFWVGLIVLSVWVVKTLFQGTGSTNNTGTGEFSSPKDILDQRYSRGEITRKQYELMKQDIS